VVVALALRALVLALGLQISGVSHAVEDALSLVVAEQVEHEQCPADGPCDDCLQGCPQCHCSNALRSMTPPAGPPAVWKLEATKLGARRTRARSPQSPDLPGLFRPPQAAFAVA
jgi:hypothetical protein